VSAQQRNDLHVISAIDVMAAHIISNGGARCVRHGNAYQVRPKSSFGEHAGRMAEQGAACCLVAVKIRRGRR